jgi:hypothetical protein
MMNLPGGISIGDSTKPKVWEGGGVRDEPLPRGKFSKQAPSGPPPAPKSPSPEVSSRGAPRAEPPGLKGLLGKFQKAGMAKKIARGSYKRG